MSRQFYLLFCDQASDANNCTYTNGSRASGLYLCARYNEIDRLATMKRVMESTRSPLRNAIYLRCRVNKAIQTFCGRIYMYPGKYLYRRQTRCGSTFQDRAKKRDERHSSHARPVALSARGSRAASVSRAEQPRERGERNIRHVSVRAGINFIS